VERTGTLSVVVVVHNMTRELPRTLRSLSPAHQHGLQADDVELIVVDNGSAGAVDDLVRDASGGRARVLRVDPAPPSPVHAANLGISAATNDLIGLLIDGARLASPGLLAGARRASDLADRPVITAPAFHLGPTTHMRAAETGYDQAIEDRLLADSGWETDGYRLFGISSLAGSSGRGLFGPMGESNSLFMRREQWDQLGGLDERFEMPGGGLANHDLYRRACALEGIELIVLLGEGTFHQYHGGAATSGQYTWDEMHAEYERIRGTSHQPPDNEPLYVGHIAPAVMPHVERSANQAIQRAVSTISRS
jgi:hypothetical protein